MKLLMNFNFKLKNQLKNFVKILITKNFSSRRANNHFMKMFLNISGQQHMWRWTGFNMGVDLIVTFDNWNLSLKRSLSSTGSNEHEALLSNHKKRHISYRVTVYSLNDQKQVKLNYGNSYKSNDCDSLFKFPYVNICILFVDRK